jgi:acyl-CoA thioester hydrolase|tara:strand:+ start:2224 stop:2721 length:498 start_codon:yes stop_codon:yes gene_type:complete
MTFPAPLIHNTTVQKEWIDYNGHMNVAFYVYAFDRGYDFFMDAIGLDQTYRDATGGTIFTAEAHIAYKGEVKLGDPLRIEAQLIAFDRKRIRTFQRMYHATENYLAATVEWMSLYVDLNQRKVSEMPDLVHENLTTMLESHKALPQPEELGRGIAMPTKKAALTG